MGRSKSCWIVCCLGMTTVFSVLAIAAAFGTASPHGQSAPASQTNRPIQDPVLNAIAAAAEMPALESAVLAPGYREILIRNDQSMVCCWPSPMLRLVEGPGEVRGSLWLFRGRTGKSGPRDDERCAVSGGHYVCVRPWQLASGDWAAVRAKLDELGAWTLDKPCNRPKVVHHANGMVSISVGGPIDNATLFVQRRVGSNITAFQCRGPQDEREADGLKANALYEYFMGLFGTIPREGVE
jgi:hypothetical protein